MKDYLVISTGGTIASSKGDNGLKPTITGEDLIRQVPQLEGRAHLIGIEDLMSKDSSNGGGRGGGGFLPTGLK